MKKVLTVVAALALLCSQANAQGFLSKLKEQAAQAMAGAMGVSETPEQAGGDAVAQSDDPNSVVTGEQALPKRRESTFGWDGPVTPSSAKFPIPLLNELPAVPSAADLINPVESKQIEFYKAIKAVTLRAEELNQNSTCEDEETLMWRKKTNDALKSAFGLTDAEIAILQDENASEADQQRISDKIAASILGGVDVNAMEADAARFENMSEEELMAQIDACPSKALTYLLNK